MPWYSFTPPAGTPNPANPNHYTLIMGTPPTCPGVNSFLCIIQAADNSGKPVLDLGIVGEIALALENRIDTTNVLLKP